MKILEDTDTINAILNQLADEGTIEPMAEPCDWSDVHPLDWADSVGLFDEVASVLYPEA